MSTCIHVCVCAHAQNLQFYFSPSLSLSLSLFTFVTYIFMLIKVMYSAIFFSVFLKVLLSKSGTPSASATRSGSGLWVPFVPQTSIVKWAKRKTPLRIQVREERE